jgi:prevent-host-death family protein
MSMSVRRVAAGAFKQGCLALLDEVAAGKVEVVVTKRGRPVARVLPMATAAEQEERILARLRAGVKGSLGRKADLLAPSSRWARWRSVSEPVSR